MNFEDFDKYKNTLAYPKRPLNPPQSFYTNLRKTLGDEAVEQAKEKVAAEAGAHKAAAAAYRAETSRLNRQCYEDCCSDCGVDPGHPVT